MLSSRRLTNCRKNSRSLLSQIRLVGLTSEILKTITKAIEAVMICSLEGETEGTIGKEAVVTEIKAEVAGEIDLVTAETIETTEGIATMMIIDSLFFYHH